jgi:hypothetical protein
MGVVTFSIPKSLVLKFLEFKPIDNFIETGTFQGGTTFWAAGYFNKVYTIEIDESLSKTTASRPDCPPNIDFLVGDSKVVLPELMQRGVAGSCLFWLDGHWCSGGGGKDEECPLLDELAAIQSKQDSIIMIDDARCFLGPLPAPHDAAHWPRIDEVFKKISELFPSHSFTILDDVIIVLPQEYLPVFDAEWQQTFQSRFFPKEKKSIWSKAKRKILGS